MSRAWKGLALGVVLGAVVVGLVIGGHSSIHESACLSPSESSPHHPWGRPDGTPTANELVVHHDYELSQNTSTKFADWVAYRLDGSTFRGDADRRRNLRLDPCLSRGAQVSDSEYDGANGKFGYDRGHLAPLATFEDSPNWDEVNFMSNIAPQHQTLNRGVWRVLEREIRDIVSSKDPAYVLTGMAYDESMPQLPNANTDHTAPSDYWKIVATGEPDDAGSFYATAFLFDQHGCVEEDNCTFDRSSFKANRVPVDEVENLTGFDFFPDLPQARQQQIESEIGGWPPKPPNGNGENGMTNVVIAEMLPNPEGRNEPAEERIRVCNQGSKTADISRWELTDDEGDFHFDEDTTLNSGECIQVFGTEYNPSGDDGEMTLANSGDTVTLKDDEDQEIDVCFYGNVGQGEVVDC